VDLTGLDDEVDRVVRDHAGEALGDALSSRRTRLLSSGPKWWALDFERYRSPTTVWGAPEGAPHTCRSDGAPPAQSIDDADVTAWSMLPAMMPARISSSSAFRSAGTDASKSWNGEMPTPSFASVPTYRPPENVPS
jgi:hypothetical protein